MTLHFAPGYADAPGGIAQFITTSFDDLLKCGSPVVGSSDIHGRDIELRNAEVWLIDIYLLHLMSITTLSSTTMSGFSPKGGPPRAKTRHPCAPTSVGPRDPVSELSSAGFRGTSPGPNPGTLPRDRVGPPLHHGSTHPEELVPGVAATVAEPSSGRARTSRASSTPCSRAQSLKLERKPCPDAATPALRSACVITLVPQHRPGARPWEHDHVVEPFAARSEQHAKCLPRQRHPVRLPGLPRRRRLRPHGRLDVETGPTSPRAPRSAGPRLTRESDRPPRPGRAVCGLDPFEGRSHRRPVQRSWCIGPDARLGRLRRTVSTGDPLARN